MCKFICRNCVRKYLNKKKNLRMSKKSRTFAAELEKSLQKN